MKILYTLWLPLSIIAGLPTIARSQTPIVISANVTHIGCAGGFTGAINLTVTGGTPGYTYDWDSEPGTSNPEDLIQLTAWTYCVTVTDAQGKTASSCIVVTDPDCPVIIKALPPLVSANGLPVTIAPEVLGGTPPYTYSWSFGGNVSPQVTVSPLSNTSYTVTVWDANGCSASRIFPVEVVGNNPAMALDFYNYGCGLSGFNSAVVHLYNLPPGNYTYTLTPSSPFQTATTGTFTGNTFVIDDICTIGCQYTLTVTNGSGITVTRTFGNPMGLIGLYITSSLKITSDNPSLCPPAAANQCERVCPNTTVTYTVGPYTPFCDGTVLTDYTWDIKGAISYFFNADKSEATITWGDSGSGFITVGNQGNGCFEGRYCVEMVEIPEANMLATPAPVAPDSALTVCQGQTVQFASQSLHADLYAWQFDDDATTATGEQTTHVFNLPGTYPVTLIARSLCYCADTTTLQVRVLDTPAPALNCVSAVCPGESVTYATTADCGNFHWAVSPNGIITGGGGITDDSISVQWLDGVDGSISLAVEDCIGSTCPVQTTIPVPVISNLAEIQGNDRVCIDTEEFYEMDAMDGASFDWEIIPQNFYTPAIVEGQGTSRIRVKFSSNTSSYSIVVKYDNCYLGCSGTDTLPLLIRRPVLISGPARVCAGQTQNFIVQGQFSTVKCDWTVFDPAGIPVETFSNVNNITPLFAQGPGEYLLLATPTAAQQNATCTQRMEWKVTVSPVPARPLGIDGPACYCPGAVQVYTADAGFYQVMWSNSINTTTDWGNPYNLAIPATASNPIWIAAKAVAADGSGCVSDTVRRWIDPLEVPKIMGTQQVCSGVVGVYAANPGIDGLHYNWEVIPAGSGVIVHGQNSASVEVFWITPGNHTLKVGICNKSATSTVTVHTAQTQMPVYPAGVCAGQLASVSLPGAWNNPVWQTPDYTVAASGAAVSLAPGTYLLTAADPNGCTVRQSIHMAEYPLPNLTISTTDPTGFCNNAYQVTMYALTDDDGHYTYDWLRDGVALGVPQNTFTTNEYGAYSAQVTNEYGCAATDGLIEIFEFCNGGGGGGGSDISFGNGLPAFCPPGDPGLQILPTMWCDSFAFQVLAGATYVPGSATWTFGQSGDTIIGTASGDNVDFTFPNGGKYLVRLTAMTLSGATCVLIDSVDVDAVAQFTVAPACPGDSTRFTDESTRLPDKTIDTWEWSFGDPAGGSVVIHSNNQVPYPYGMSNNYVATLTVTAGSGCQSASSQVVEVPPLPNLTLPAIANGCVDQVVALSAESVTGIVHMDWDFGQPGSIGNLASGTTVYHYFGSTPGVFPVTATAENVWGCSESVAQMAVVSNNDLTGEISPSGVFSICSGETMPLTAPVAGASYLWSNGAISQTIEAGTEGVYQVTVTGASGCTYIPGAVVLFTNPSPGGFIQAQLINDLGQNIGVTNTELEVCYGEQVTLQAVTNDSYTYAWSASLGTEQWVVFSEDRVNLLAVGSYSYQVTITDAASGCSSVTPPFTVKVNPVPTGVTAATSTPCAGDPAEVAYTGPADPDLSFSWNTGATGPSFITTIPGRYIVTATNPFGCSASSEPAILSPGPNIAAIPAGCHARCLPDTICLPDLPGVVGWQWYLNGMPVPGATSADFVALESGTYYAELTDTLGCTAISGPLSLQLFEGAGSVFGRVWSDVNHNGIIDAADTLVAGISVLLLEDVTQLAAVPSASNGEAAFINIPSTDYFIRINTPALNPFWEVVIGTDSVLVAGCGAKGYGDLLIDHCSIPLDAVVLEACAGTSVDYLGIAIPAGQSHAFTLASVSGCDTVLTVSVNVLPAAGSNWHADICPNDVYVYQGVNLTVGQTQAFTLTSSAGCDSVVTVTVGSLPVSTSSLLVNTCAGSTYTYQGVSLAIGETMDFMFTNASGCDSIVTVTVGSLPVSTSSLLVNTCAGSTYTYQGVSLAIGETMDFMFTNASGCDSIMTVTVGALPVSTSSLLVNTCAGSTYTYQGVSLAVGETMDFTFTNASGCDSIVTVTVGALPVSTSTLQVNTCAGSTYTYEGVNLAVGETMDFMFTNASGCDSIVTVTVGALPVSTSSLLVNTCAGSTYTYQGVSLAIGETMDFTFTNIFGCDSTVTVTVGALPVSSGTASFRVCPNETYTFQGQALAAGTVQDFTLTSWLGCDSIVTVTILEKTTSLESREVNVCPGLAYVYHGETIEAGQEKVIHFTNYEGCDSLISIRVTAWPAVDIVVETEQSCATSGTGSLTVQVMPGGGLPAGFALNGTDFQSNTQFNALLAGDYTVSVRDDHGCVFHHPAVIETRPGLMVELPGAYLIPCDSMRITLAPELGGDTSGLQLHWWNGATTPTATTAEASPVWLDATNYCGESLHREARVDWANSDGEPINIYVPNIFAPAAKNAENTMFRAFFGNNVTLLDYRIEVYDRWGNMLFESEQPEVGWTGPFRDKIMDPGVFVWQLWVKVAFCGRELELYKKGDVTVER